MITRVTQVERVRVGDAILIHGLGRGKVVLIDEGTPRVILFGVFFPSLPVAIRVWFYRDDLINVVVEK